MADGLPATIYRPGIVVGDSATGETLKYDGPYFIAGFLQPAAGSRRGRPEGRRPRRRPGVPGASRLRGRRDGRVVGPGCLGRPDLRPDRPHPPTVRAGRRRLRRTARQAGGVGAVAPRADARADRPGARHGAAARPARRGRGLLRLADDVLHRATRRPTWRARGCAARPSTSTPTAWSTSCASMPRSARRRWSEMADPRGPHRRQRQPHRARARLRHGRHLPGPRRSGSSGSGPPATSTPPQAWSSSWAPQADAIAVTGVREARAVGLYDGELDAIDRVKQATTDVPVSDGHALRDVLQEWAIRHLQTELPGYLTNARTVVLGGAQPRRGPRGSSASSPTTSSSPTRCCASTCRPRSTATPLLGLAVATALWPAHLLPGLVKSTDPGTGHRAQPRPGPQGRPGRRRRRGDVRRARRLRPGGPRRQDRHHAPPISDDRLAELAEPRRRHGARQRPAAVPRHRRPRPCSRR